MSQTNNKALPITLSIIVALGLIIFFGVKHIKKNILPNIKNMATAVQDDAQKFAKGKKSSDCVKEALLRNTTDDSIKGQIKTKLFLHFCLKKAALEKDLCINVPTYGEVIKSATWSVNECVKKGYPKNDICPRVLQEVIKFCDDIKGK